MLSEASQRKTKSICYHLNAESQEKKWYKQTLKIRNRLTDLVNKFKLTKGERLGKGIILEFGTDIYTLLYIEHIVNKDLLYNTGNSTNTL